MGHDLGSLIEHFPQQGENFVLNAFVKLFKYQGSINTSLISSDSEVFSLPMVIFPFCKVSAGIAIFIIAYYKGFWLEMLKFISR